MTKQIPLNKGQVSIVDDEDYELVAPYNWRLHPEGYAITRGKKGQPETLRMHRLIMNPPAGMVVDHINNNPLDNRRCNLRVCTQRENTRNRSRNKGCKFKGITPANGKWNVKVVKEGVATYYGAYDTPEEAAAVYNTVAVQLFGVFAKLNDGVGFKEPVVKRSNPVYKGVTYHKRYGTWIAQKQVNGKTKHLGSYPTPEAAKEAYDKFCATLSAG